MQAATDRSTMKALSNSIKLHSSLPQEGLFGEYFRLKSSSHLLRPKLPVYLLSDSSNKSVRRRIGSVAGGQH